MFDSGSGTAIENIPAMEIFVSGIDHIELVGGQCYRLVLYSGGVERTVVVKLILPLESFAGFAYKLLAAIGRDMRQSAPAILEH